MTRRVVVTGLGIVSSLGNNKKEVHDSLYQARSGIKFQPEYEAHGLRSHVAGSIDLDFSELIDRKLLRFMAKGHAYAWLAMQEAIQDANHLYQSTDIKLEKTRYKTTFEGNKVDIDVYPDGRTSAEIEYEIEVINIPDYCGEEITGNKEWSNLNIAKKNKIQNGKPSRRRKITTKQSLGKKSQGI